MQKQELSYEDTKFTLDTYWLDPISDFDEPLDHPLAIICPGGAFKFHTDRESQPIAMKFNAEGIHALVLRYQLIDDEHTVYPLALQELATTLNWLKAQSKSHQIDLSKILLVGFSAGGHVVADFNSIMLNPDERKKIFPEELEVQPAANILGYSVIDMTLGWPREEEWTMKVSSDIYYWQAQEHLTKDGKPTFMWQTVTDGTVPVMNSIIYAQKMDFLGIPYELHLFGSGDHGLSLATYVTQNPNNEANLNVYDAKWWELCVNWLKLQKILPKL
ncbi:alpha/beta hydrolase [Companilactobacillus halodurans]|uniref:Alpha/beta hydrolase n=1 Tax=Companilactobacillus halodurans TaxID=2584183 RepID=A0A5P0ZUY7_9LACO|nr:alpha/beta hydrolase [Companilactobacillus halodurans]MQS76824.1 alpha/beta hydrolase [Companilactobacillus halodurans]MQS96725.1 alpha/beta hydrolase [Companilactobacillus halodurans]